MSTSEEKSIELLKRSASMMEFTAPKLRQEIKTHLNTLKLLSSKQLWATQLQNYPESVELTNQQVFRWADSMEAYPGEARSRWRNIAMALNRGNGFFYITNPKNGFVGYRYGLADSEYLSGFGQGWHFKLADSVLIELKEQA